MVLFAYHHKPRAKKSNMIMPFGSTWYQAKKEPPGVPRGWHAEKEKQA